VLVAGDLMLDEFVWGRVSRISPEAPVPVVEVERRTDAAGGAANAAMNVASLGGRASVVGLVGPDAAGDRVLQRLADTGIDTTPVRRGAGVTTVKTRVVAHSQQVVRIDQEDATAPTPAVVTGLLNAARLALRTVRSVVISDYGKGVVRPEFVVPFLAAANERGVPVVVDPKGTDYAKYRGATLVKPNQAEAGKVLNRDLKTDADVAKAGADLLDLLGGDTAVLITRGAHGMTLFRRGAAPHHVPTHAREVYDVTGAGDTVAGTLGLALAAGIPLPLACDLASRAAGVVVQKLGTATLTPDELRPAARRAA
jgi:rfaE bifunctional protein kinase chain/domain